MNHLCRFADEHFRVAGRVQLILHPQHSLCLRKRQIRHGPVGLANLGVAAIPGNAHDGVLGFRSPFHRHMVSHSFHTVQVAIDEGLIDNRNFRRTGSIGVLDVPALPQRNSKCMQKGRSDKIHAYTCKRTVGSWVTPVHEHAVVIAVSAADTHFHDRRGVHSRQRAHAL